MDQTQAAAASALAGSGQSAASSVTHRYRRFTCRTRPDTANATSRATHSSAGRKETVVENLVIQLG